MGACRERFPCNDFITLRKRSVTESTRLQSRHAMARDRSDDGGVGRDDQPLVISKAQMWDLGGFLADGELGLERWIQMSRWIPTVGHFLAFILQSAIAVEPREDVCRPKSTKSDSAESRHFRSYALSKRGKSVVGRSRHFALPRKRRRHGSNFLPSSVLSG